VNEQAARAALEGAERMRELARTAWTAHRARMTRAVRLNAWKHGARSEERLLIAAAIHAADELARAAEASRRTIVTE
jgi:hypothetical protein